MVSGSTEVIHFFTKIKQNTFKFAFLITDIAPKLNCRCQGKNDILFKLLLNIWCYLCIRRSTAEGSF